MAQLRQTVYEISLEEIINLHLKPLGQTVNGKKISLSVKDSQFLFVTVTEMPNKDSQPITTPL